MRETLAAASDLLASAADDADDHADRLGALGDQLGSLADQARDVDHRRPARIPSRLAEITPAADDSLAPTPEAAHDGGTALPETIEGV